ncbi:MATE efflux family protein 3, chloroplastic [Hordeum vulgare]|nr:MATE efflux family protein 3, chloroplastic [Hordeum vulgare]
MDRILGWHKVVEELTGNNQELRAQYREIAGWFASVQMMRNHARGLVKVMTAAEKQHAFPRGFIVPPVTILLWAMCEAEGSPNPRQRAHWWMYRSSTTPPAGEDHVRVTCAAAGAVLDEVEGHKNLPIDVEKLPEVADLPEAVVVKQEVLEEDVVEPAPGKKKRAAGKKTPVRRSERVKMLKKEE